MKAKNLQKKHVTAKLNKPKKSVKEDKQAAKPK